MSPPALTPADVAELAILARLELTDHEARRLALELGSILGVMAQLAQVDTTGVAPMTHVADGLDVAALRPDAIAPSLPAAQALAGAPVHAGNYFSVPVAIAGDGTAES